LKKYLGNSSHLHINGILRQHNIQKVFLVSNRNSFFKGGIWEYLRNILGGCDFLRFYDFNINPQFDDLLKGIETFLQYDPDLIMGIGGGSAMDMAKLIRHLAAYPVIDKKTIINSGKDYKSTTPLMLIPTTSGSGSEATRFAVLYIDGVKHSLCHDSILADYAIVDGLFSAKLPEYITAYTAIDAVCQAVESYWAKGADKKSRSYALKGLRYLVPSICDAVTRPNLQLREKMAIGSFYAGQAINISKTTLPHALSYYLTSKYNLAHGHAVGIILPYFLIANTNKMDITPVLKVFKVQSPAELQSRFITIMRKIGLYMRIEDIIKTDMEPFIDAVNRERMINNPVSFTKEQLISIFKSR